MRVRALTVLSACGLLVVCLGASGCKSGGGGSKEIAMVTVSYTAKPTMSLPRGMDTVAVLDSGTTNATEAKWSKMAANMISGLLGEASRKSGGKLKVADRKNLTRIMAENDLALAGLVDGANAAKAIKVLDVQGLIDSSITVKVEKHKGKGRTITAANIASWRWGGGIRTEEVDNVSRNITVQCTFRLQDKSNKIVVERVSPTLRKTDKTKTSPFFGASKTEAELTPRDKIIGELVEKEVRRFIGQFLPVEIEETIQVQASKNDSCKAGVRFLAAGEYDEAIGMFKQAIAADEEGQDKHATFGMGVACEAKGSLDEALKHYRTAVRLDADGAEKAMKRVKARASAVGG